MVPFTEVLLQTAIEKLRLEVDRISEPTPQKMAFDDDAEEASLTKRRTLAALSKLARVGLPAVCVLFSVVYFLVGVGLSMAGVDADDRGADARVLSFE